MQIQSNYYRFETWNELMVAMEDGMGMGLKKTVLRLEV